MRVITPEFPQSHNRTIARGFVLIANKANQRGYCNPRVRSKFPQHCRSISSELGISFSQTGHKDGSQEDSICKRASDRCAQSSRWKMRVRLSVSEDVQQNRSCILTHAPERL